MSNMVLPAIERLSATDTAALFADADCAPLHVGGVVIVRPEPARRAHWHDDLARLLERRLSLVPRFRQKVYQVPGRLAPPVWADDPDFDIGFHIRRSALGAPGSHEQLTELIGRLISQPLDHQRPLWELYLIDGLADGCVAIVNKTHQAVVDRLGAVSLAEALLDRVGQHHQQPLSAWSPRPAPSRAQLLAGAFGELASRPAGLLDAAWRAMGDLGSTALRCGRATATAATSMLSLLGPQAPGGLATRSTSQRLFTTAQLDVALLRRISTARNCTVNDVILAAMTGALRAHLLASSISLSTRQRVRALVPMSTQTAPGRQTMQTLLIELPVSEPNPVLRLDAIAFATKRFAESGRPVGADALITIGRFSPPTLHVLAARVASTLSARSYDVLISNVAGARGALALAGAPVVALYPIAPLAGGQLLAIGCTSHAGQVNVGITVDRSAGDTAGILGTVIGEALSELTEAMGVRARRRRTKGTS